MVQRTFYAYESEQPPENPAWEPAADDVHTLRHGYNLADLNRLAHVAVQRAFGHTVDWPSRFDAAWYGIVETLYSLDVPPDPADLIAAGWRAVNAYCADEAHHDGINTNTWRNGSGHARYWECAARTTPSPENRVVEREALWQIWPTLTDGQRRALLALAALGDYSRAAAAVGIGRTAFGSVISKARARFLTGWHEGEEPSGPWRKDRRVGNHNGLDQYGKRRITVTQLEAIRARYEAGETLAVISTDYGVKKACLSSLLTGRSRPAPDPA